MPPPVSSALSARAIPIPHFLVSLLSRSSLLFLTLIYFLSIRNDSRREIYSKGGLASTTSCAHLYTCPFWISVRLYLRGRSKSNKQSGVFLRENETKVNYNE